MSGGARLLWRRFDSDGPPHLLLGISVLLLKGGGGGGDNHSNDRSFSNDCREHLLVLPWDGNDDDKTRLCEFVVYEILYLI